MPDMEGFKELGPSGTFISMMSSAIIALAGAVGFQWRQANKIYGYRLAERDTLNKALTDNTAAINAFTRASEERNRVTADLSDAIDKLAAAFERNNYQDELLHKSNDERQKDQTKAFNAFADSMRVHTGMVTTIRDFIENEQRRRSR